ncbi:MAG: zinc ribbon domain-containing protein [Planctomycetales bacterium]
MNDEEKLNPGHLGTRGVLRIVGPFVAGIGLLFTIAGIGSFFASFGTFEPPQYFWCAFVGLPLIALGVGISKYAFMGRIFRYVAGETAPVAKDTFNYIAEGTQQGVRAMATAVGEGLRIRGSELQCAKCGQSNDTDAKFCRKCGASLDTTCPSCAHLNDAGASYCEACGKPIAMNPNS